MNGPTDLSHRDIHNNSVPKMFLIALSKRATFGPAMRLVWTAISEFFIPQFQTKFGLAKRTVVSVDHPLDESIPFRPEYINIYLHFIPVWIKSLYFVYREFGKQTITAIRDFVRAIDRLYREAGTVYRRCQSTTDRPHFVENSQFKMIHSVDPHLHCIPSLHVLIVVFNAMRISQMIDEFSTEKNDYPEQKRYVYGQAVKIIESILFVKQHSVNCIPAALFAMTNLHPDFDSAEAQKLIEALFIHQNNDLETAVEIRSFLWTQYKSFLDTRDRSGADYKEILVEYLVQFPHCSA